MSNIPQSFKVTLTSGSEYYRPVLISSFIIDANLGKLDPSIYRFTNVLLHAIGSVLVFLVLIKLNYQPLPSFLLGLFFSVHPMLTPAASWISGRNDSLITIFLLLSFIFMISFLDSKKPIKWLYVFLHLLTFILALFTKEIGAFFPFLAIIYILLLRKEKILRMENGILLAGWVVTGLIWWVMRESALKNVNSPDTMGIDAVVKNIPALFVYIGKVFVPVRLAPLSMFELTAIISGIVAIVAIAVYTILSKNIRKKYVLFGALWYFFFIVPTLLVRLQDDFFDYAEHRVYLLLVGIIIIIYEILRSLNINFKKIVTIIISVVLLSGMSAYAFNYQKAYKNMFTFWGRYVKTYPERSKGYYNVGLAYYSRDILDKAEKYYKKGIELDSTNIDLFINLAAVYLKQGKYEIAIDLSNRGLKINPMNPLANYNLGKAYMMVNNYEKACEALEKAITYTPNSDWFFTFGYALTAINDYEKAIPVFNEAIKLNPKNYQAYISLADVYFKTEKFYLGEQVCLELIKRNPLIIDPYHSLIRYYDKAKNTQRRDYYLNQLKEKGLPLPNEFMK